MCLISLSRIAVGDTGVVACVTTPEPMRRRLMDMGFTRGAQVRSLYRAAGGDPTAYAIRGAVVALRARDARGIRVKRGGESDA
jgi:ferrous iron transport protein A